MAPRSKKATSSSRNRKSRISNPPAKRRDPDETRIVFVRHAQSAANRVKTVAGRTDSPLSSLGKKQARGVAFGLAKTERIDAVYASCLTRALRTAGEIVRQAGLPVPVIVDERLTERDLGKLAGKTWDEIERRYPAIVKNLRADPDFTPCGCESVREVRARAGAFVRAIAGKHRGETVAVVTHAGFLRAFFENILMRKNVRAAFDNASVSIVSAFADGTFLVRKTNDTSHLKKINRH